jgi:G8 domain
MSSRHRLTRSILAVSLISALTILAPSPAGGATLSAKKGTRAKPWSNPATWGGTVPGQGDRVVIPSGASVKLDTNTPALGGLRVDGKLSFARKNLELKSDWIMVHGTFRVGSEQKPFTHRAEITLTGDDRTVNVMDMGNKFLGVMTGALELHGQPIDGWTKLSSTAQPGNKKIVVADDMDWRPGDEIVIASTDYWSRHDEERTITAVDGNELELDRALDYQHWGTIQTIAGRDIDERAEVGLLSRNVVVRGNDASTNNGFGGHMMIMEAAEARIDGVEFDNMGQKNALRRYPVHFHMDGKAPESYLQRSSIHHSFNRCVTVHGTNELRVKDNVCYDHLGHGFFMEDGAERRNVITGNLGLGTRANENGLLPSDRSPATFWITNPDNTVSGNVAAGSDGFGFWYALPEHPTGLSDKPNIWPRRTPLRAFDGNVAHSNGDTGLNVDDGPRPNGETDSTWYRPVSDTTNPDSPPVVARFENFTAYMNRDRGVWLRGEDHVVSGAVLADNRAGATFASSETFLENSFVVGETDNMGTTEDWEDPGYGGRALPLFWDPGAQIIGFEFYDGRVGVSDTTFANFNSNPVRGSGGLGYLADNAFAIHPKNFAENVDFVNSNRVYLPDPTPGMDGDMAKVFVDVDGSVTGTAGETVVINNPFLLRSNCEYTASWNAHTCTSDYASLMVGTMDGNPNDIKPVTLRRSDGVTQTLMGCCDDSLEAHTTIIPDRAYEVGFNGGTPTGTRYVLWNGRGHTVDISIEVASLDKVTRWGQALPSVSSLSALAQRTDTSYFHDAVRGIVHVRISGKNSDWEEVKVIQ